MSRVPSRKTKLLKKMGASINDRKRIQERAIYHSILSLLGEIEEDKGIDITNYMHLH